MEHFGGEKQAIEAIISADIASISEIEGMSVKSAISLVLEAFSQNTGVAIRDFLKTREAFEIYERIMALLCDCARTDYARNKLHLYYPYPSGKKDLIMKVQQEVRSVIKMTQGIDDKEISGFLGRIKPLRTKNNIPIIRDRVIITHNSEEFEAAKKFPVSVQLVENPTEAIDIARGYSHIFMSQVFAGHDFPEELDIDFIDIRKVEAWQVAPELEVAFFSKNLESIQCAISVFMMIRRYAPDFCAKIKDDDIIRLESLLKTISIDNDIKSGIDVDIDRQRSIYERLKHVTASMERQVNLEFGSLIEKSSITVKGFDLLSAMNGGINQIFEKEIREKYNMVISNAMKSIDQELGLNIVESQYVSNFFSEEPSHPIRVNNKGVEGLKNYLLRSITSRKLVLMRETARRLSSLKETASNIVRDVLDFDTGYTIAFFARKFNLQMPEIRENCGIGLIEGKSLFLEDPVLINYSVGASRLYNGIDKLKCARVVLLSGVNSGGKTSTIDLLAQTMILAHMGFPVPANECEVGLVEEFYYFGKSKGTMDAGAFESTIKDFAAVANPKSKVVLADEMESITEPGASAKIISGILEELMDNNGIGVFVTHLAESILENTDRGIRVDGIEAKGLDENLNLIVDRNPRYNYLARSTPELIVERLARKNEKVEFYSRLLRKFK
jgi:hypothetical protein